jgi:putative two-component system protein, hydrogenase maturation factor HypX/HoxX
MRRAAIEAILDALDRLALAGEAQSANGQVASVAMGPCLPLLTQESRAIDWKSDRTDRVLRKIRAGDGHPGVLDEIAGQHFHLFGGHPERTLRGRTGELLAQRDGAICRATVDGAVWITHLKRQASATDRHFKLPAARARSRRH